MNSLFSTIEKNVKYIVGDIALRNHTPLVGGRQFSKDVWEQFQDSSDKDFDYEETKDMVNGLDSLIQNWSESTSFKEDWNSLEILSLERLLSFSESSYISIRSKLSLEEISCPLASLFSFYNDSVISHYAKTIFNLPINIDSSFKSNPEVTIRLLTKVVMQHFPVLPKIDFTSSDKFENILMLSVLKNFFTKEQNENLTSLENIKVPLSLALKIYKDSNELYPSLLSRHTNSLSCWIEACEENYKDILLSLKERSTLDSALQLSRPSSQETMKV